MVWMTKVQPEIYLSECNCSPDQFLEICTHLCIDPILNYVTRLHIGRACYKSTISSIVLTFVSCHLSVYGPFFVTALLILLKLKRGHDIAYRIHAFPLSHTHDGIVKSMACYHWFVSVLIGSHVSIKQIKLCSVKSTLFQGYGSVHIRSTVEKVALHCTGYFNIKNNNPLANWTYIDQNFESTWHSKMSDEFFRRV